VARREERVARREERAGRREEWVARREERAELLYAWVPSRSLRGALPDELAREPSPLWSTGRSLVAHRSDCVGHRYEEVGVRKEERRERSELEAHHWVCLGVLEVFGPHPYERGAMPDP
jgi:hypothetical protein